MKRRRAYIYVTVILLLLLFMCSQLIHPSHVPLNAQKGILDLQQHSFEKTPVIGLHGEWAFSWKDFSGQSPIYVEVPNEWTNYKRNGKDIPPNGYANYRLTMKLRPEDVGKRFAFYLPEIGSSYVFKVNGETLYKNGIIATSRKDYFPENRPSFIAYQPTQDVLQIDILTANYMFYHTGLWKAIEFGDKTTVLTEYNLRMMKEAFIIGGMLILAIYHMVFYLKRRNDLSSLYFGLICLAVAIRTSTTGNIQLGLLFPFLNWTTMLRIEHVSTFLLFIAFYKYFHSVLHQPLKPLYLKIVTAVCFISACMSAFLPSSIFTYTKLPFAFFVLCAFIYILILSIRSIQQGVIEGYWNVVGLMCIIYGITNDIFIRLDLLEGMYIAPLGLLCFVIIHVTLNAARYSHSYAIAERLSNELNVLNKQLEKKVQERTLKLEKAYQELEESESARTRMISLISHDLSSPLSVQKIVAKGMLDGIIPLNERRYVASLYNQVQFMETLLADMKELVLMEGKQLSFDFQRVDFKEYMYTLFQSYEAQIRAEKLTFVYHSSLEKGKRHEVLLDPTRIEQIFSNLLSNAVKFTPAGGMVEVSVWKDAKTVSFRVKDNGCGFSEENTDKLFEHMYRTTPVRTDKQSTGLGLSIAKEIIKAHKGTITAESQPQKGASFTVTLPVNR
ncbi:sensor histidine kinase [Bacillus sp. REN10]|uniref:sensor histidine kinase n=1 Tax=Bacillus sp. REN10 TaxID=2782541 RepID=UPI00193BF125|nr:sensor histidine kinase [Bacillus sp. REN10]